MNPFKKRPSVPGIGYLRHRVDPEEMTMVGQWVAVEEIFEGETPGGIAIIRTSTQTATRGRIVKAGPECELDGLNEGDEVIYEEWQGGRHDLGGKKVLIMSTDHILARVE